MNEKKWPVVFLTHLTQDHTATLLGTFYDVTMYWQVNSMVTYYPLFPLTHQSHNVHLCITVHLSQIIPIYGFVPC